MRKVSNQSANALSRRGFLARSAVGLGASALVMAAKPETAAPQMQPTRPTGDILEKILRTKQMNVAVVVSPPDSFKKDNQWQGVFVEAAKWLAKEMGVNIEYVEAQFGTFVAALQSGRADVSLAASYATVARAIAVDFTQPIFYYGYGVIVRKVDVNKWKSVEDADRPGVTFVAKDGTPQQKWLQLNLKQAKINILAANVEQINKTMDILSGRSDVYIEDDYVVKQLVAQYKDQLAEMPAYAETPWQLNAVAWSVAKGQPGLLNVLNVAIDQLMEYGLMAKWQEQFGGKALFMRKTYFRPHA